MLKILNEGKISAIFNNTRKLLPENIPVYNFRQEYMYNFNDKYVI